MTKYRANRSKSVFWLAHPYEKNFFHFFLCFYGSLYHFEPYSNRGNWILWIEVQNERAYCRFISIISDRKNNVITLLTSWSFTHHRQSSTSLVNNRTRNTEGFVLQIVPRQPSWSIYTISVDTKFTLIKTEHAWGWNRRGEAFVVRESENTLTTGAQHVRKCFQVQNRKR